VRGARDPPPIVGRHPFPARPPIRILGDVTAERVAVLQAAEAIVDEEIRGAGLYDRLWQAFAVLLPVKTVRRHGDARTYENVLAIRAVDSVDGMTADWAAPARRRAGPAVEPADQRGPGRHRVVYDISRSPPATIEWEWKRGCRGSGVGC